MQFVSASYQLIQSFKNQSVYTKELHFCITMFSITAAVTSLMNMSAPPP